MAKTMSWFYYDKSGNRKGPITQSALQEMAKQEIITPTTRMETDNGKSGVAGQISGLFPPPPPPRPSFIETMASSMRATMSFIASTLGFVLFLVLVVFVVLLLWCLLEMANVVPHVMPYNPFVPSSEVVEGNL